MFNKKKVEPTPKAEVAVMSKGEWMQKYWRPSAAFMYIICCLADFAVFPIMFTVVQFWETQAANDAFRQWVPITLQGGGLFHVSMCAVLGVSAYGRTQEKLAGQSATPPGASNGGLSLPTSGVATPSLSSTSPAPVANSWGSQPLGSGSGFGSTPAPSTSGFSGGSGFGAPASAEVITGFGGKPAPVIPPFPEK